MATTLRFFNFLFLICKIQLDGCIYWGGAKFQHGTNTNNELLLPAASGKMPLALLKENEEKKFNTLFLFLKRS
jgi:hypothetical protein